MKFYTSQFNFEDKCYSAEASELALPVGSFPLELTIAEPNTLNVLTFEFVRYDTMSDEVVAAVYHQTGDVRLTGNQLSVKIYND